MKQHTDKFLRKRKFFMVLPLLVLPFITMIFWALGGANGMPAEAQATELAGLNLTLPDAHFGEKEIWDKLTLYEMADRDSAKYEEARESDPYFDLIAFKSQQQLQPQGDSAEAELIDSFKHKDRLSTDANEERVNRKLQALYAELHKPNVQPSEFNKQTNALSSKTASRETLTAQEGLPAEALRAKEGVPAEALGAKEGSQFTADVDRLEGMMEMMHDDREPDPEMQQIANVLEKILDIQHPERVKEKLNAIENKRKETTLPVEAAGEKDDISLIDPVRDALNADGIDSLNEGRSLFEGLQNGFFGLDETDNTTQLASGSNTIPAVIHDTQELVAGATVKMRLVDDIDINARRLSKGQFIYGICAINGERLDIDVTSIRTGNSLLPVSLKVYDLDGLPGIYIPGAISRDAAKQASDNALQNIQLSSLNPSIGAQAASAGIEAAKGLFSKKAKLIKVTVKAGYKIFLKDTKPTSTF